MFYEVIYWVKIYVELVFYFCMWNVLVELEFFILLGLKWK